MAARTSARASAPDIRAGGGVVWRMRQGRVEVALVHRPRYDDWSLPKGKVQPGESDLAAAVREVGEELGSRVAVSRYIGSISYFVGQASKKASYWAMNHLEGQFECNDEVDDVRWLRPVEARELMTHPIERTVLADFAAVPLPDSMVVLVRHAKAGKRSEWRGADCDRPLDEVGEAQARRLVPFLTSFAPDRVISAEPVRCIATVTPFATERGLDVAIDPVFGDASFDKAPAAAETALYSLAKPGRVTVVASQGGTIPALIDRVGRGMRPSDTRKGAAWALSIVDGTVVSADYYEDAAR